MANWTETGLELQACPTASHALSAAKTSCSASTVRVLDGSGESHGAETAATRITLSATKHAMTPLARSLMREPGTGGQLTLTRCVKEPGLTASNIRGKLQSGRVATLEDSGREYSITTGPYALAVVLQNTCAWITLLGTENSTAKSCSVTHQVQRETGSGVGSFARVSQRVSKFSVGPAVAVSLTARPAASLTERGGSH